jgi:hypothetical protein
MLKEDIMEKSGLKKLTEEQKQKIIKVMDDFSIVYFSDDSTDSEFTTEYDILMKEKQEEFKLHSLEDNEPFEIDALIEMCEKYLEEKRNPKGTFFGAAFGFIMMWDMWLNKSAGWPVRSNPEWEEWEKLKERKVKKSDYKK